MSDSDFNKGLQRGMEIQARREEIKMEELPEPEQFTTLELQAIDFILQHGGIDGGHHKQWVLDQVLRILAGEAYEVLVEEYCDGEDDPNTYEWDEGIAP